jgi:biotin carboxyl carrier protein
MPGTILDVMVKTGQRVREGQTLLVMEAMKMEHRIQALEQVKLLQFTFRKETESIWAQI